MPAARRSVPPVDELTLAPTAAQEQLLTDTMIRFNAAAEAAGAVGFAGGVTEAQELTRASQDELARFGLPATLRRIAVERAAHELRRARRKPRFGRFQAIPFADTVQWPAPTQARLWTARGRWTINVEPDPSYGWVRSPLEGRPLSLRRRGDGAFVLVAEDREADDE